MVESTIRYSKSGSSDIASKIRHQTPLMLHRLKRRNTLFQSPNASGRSRQGEPVRTIHSTPSTNIRLSRPIEPFWSGRPMISGQPLPRRVAQHQTVHYTQDCTPKGSLESCFQLNVNPWSPHHLVHCSVPMSRTKMTCIRPIGRGGNKSAIDA